MWRPDGRAPWRSAIRLACRRVALVGLAVLGGCTADPVSAPAPDRVRVNAPLVAGRLTLGQSVQLEASVTARGAAVAGAQMEWTSRAPGIASVAPDGTLSGLARGSTQIVTAVAGLPAVQDSVTITVVGASAIAMDTRVLSLEEAAQRRLRATVTLDAGATTPAVTWRSTAPTVALVDNQGLVTALTPGTAVIRASALGISDSAVVTVVPQPVGTVVIDQTNGAFLIGDQRQYSATIRNAANAILSGRTITWATTNPAVATVSSAGLVTAVGAGSTTLSAASGGKVAQLALTVRYPAASIVVSPASPRLPRGGTQALTAQVRNARDSVLTDRSVTWTSSAPTIATVSATGVVTGVANGTATLTASAEGITGTATVTVVEPVAAVQVTPATATLLVGATQQLSASARDAKGAALTGRLVTWSSSNPSVATVSATGLVTTLAAGSATLTATVEGVEGTAVLTVAPLPAAVTGVSVSPARVTITAGQTREVIPTVTQPAGAPAASVTFGTTTPAVATVSPEGVITAVAPGTATITVTATSAGSAAFAEATATAMVTVTVVAAVATVQVAPSAASLLVGRTRQLTVSARDSAGAAITGRAVVWTTSDASVATVSATGLVTAVSVGIATLSATVDGVEGTAELTVTPLPAAVTGVAVSPSTVSLFMGRSRLIAATVEQPIGAPIAVVTYGSTVPSVATVSATGVITGVASGTATITVTATAAGNASFSAATASTTLEVTVSSVPVASVQVTPGTVNLIVGGTQQMATTVRDSVGTAITGRVVNWTSSNTAVATISATGLVTAVTVGTATLTASVDGAIGTALLAVGPLPAGISRLTLSSTSQSLAVGQTRAVAPLVTQPTGAPAATVTYGTTTPGVATVSSAGVITAVAPGTAVITATATAPGNANFSAATLSETVAVTVLEAVASVQVAPGTATLMVGTTQQLTITVRDTTGAPLTGRAVAWGTSSASIATVNATGLVTAVAVGTATITATVGGVPGTATIIVSPLPSSITDLTVTPTTVSLRGGRTQALTPTVTQPAGAATATVTYGTTTPNVATVSVTGVITAVAPGTATITVTATAVGNTGYSAASRTATATVTVTAVPVITVQVAPATASVLTGSTQQLVVTPRDSAGQALTGRTVSWASLNAAVATVNASGLVTGVTAGTATITATVDGVVGNATLTVQPAPPAVTEVTVSPTSVSLGAGQTRALSPTVTQPTGATTATVSYGTSDPAVATVSSAGVITGVTVGSATITVTATAPGSTGFSAASTSTTVPVTVVPPAINSLAVSPTSATLAVGLTQTLTPTVSQPVGAATATVTYGTSAPGVATVSPSGVVTAVGSGTATITVTATAAANGSYASATQTTTVTITVP